MAFLRWLAIALIPLTFLPWGVVQGTTVYVPDDFVMIQGAINGVVDGDTVIVRAGNYIENIDFKGKAIVVKSESGPSATVINGDQNGSVVTFESNEDSTSVLDGFTVTNGNGTGDFFNRYGGGIYCRLGSSPTIINNIITGNTAYRGGGIWCYIADPTITNNIITSNSVSFGGGGFSSDASSPTITNNIFMGNNAFNGGAIYIFSSFSFISGNTIVGNSSDSKGGGIYCRGLSTPVISNNIIADNTSDGFGGAIYSFDESDPIITNNVFARNNANTGGGGLSTGSGSSPIVTNTIFWANNSTTGPEINIGFLSDVTISYSDVRGGQDMIYVGGVLNWGAGMINTNPLFSDSLYHLQLASPCVDTGDPAITDVCAPPGLGGTQSDMGAYGGMDNCWSLDQSTKVMIYPNGSIFVSPGDTLKLNTFILNTTANTATGDFWLTVRLPNMNEVVIPETNVNHSNPISGPIGPLGFVRLPGEIYIPSLADSAQYTLIGRIGVFPGTVIDEMSFDFLITP